MEPSKQAPRAPAAPPRRWERPFLSIRWVLFTVLALLTLGGGVTSIVLGYNVTSDAVVGEAQRRVAVDLRGAWAGYLHELERVALVVRLTSQTQKAQDLLTGANIDRERATIRVEEFRRHYGLDVLAIVGTDGKVVLRSRYPYQVGDTAYHDAVLARALHGHPCQGTVLVPAAVLESEGQYLRDQAFMELKETPMAAPTHRSVEADGMMLKAAEPVFDSSNRLIGAVYGGVLLNRNFALLDGIRDTIFKNETYGGKALGTVTIFQGDLRIATNVMNQNGTRAIGTRVSKVVRDQTLENAQPYYDRAFVVNDWYLTAYDPIRDPEDKVIGILYVGVLEQKFLDYKTGLTRSFIGLTGVGVLISLIVALGFAVWLSAPIKRLTRVAGQLSGGDFRARVRLGRDLFKEISHLNRTFNQMADTVVAHGDALARANAELEKSNSELTQLNQNYLDLLGFVTHELKSPLASTMFSLSAIQQGYFGTLTGEQRKVVDSMEKNVEYLNEMILNYLNLSRIERGELQFSPEKLVLRSEVLDPVVEQIRRQLESQQMTLELQVPPELQVQGDANLLKIVFDNLLSNAIKYGTPGSVVRIAYGGGAGGTHRFSVRNQGFGISESDLQKLFKKFSRLAVSELRAQKGTGLGLFITQSIVHQHGGRIWADSRPGDWTEFSFELPATMPQRAPA